MKLVFVHIRGSRRGQTDVFDKYKIVVGTHYSCDIRFSDLDDRGVCCIHSEIVCIDTAVIIKDVSINAFTFVNNELIKESALHDGDVVKFGNDGPEICVRIVKDTNGDESPEFVGSADIASVSFSNGKNKVSDEKERGVVLETNMHSLSFRGFVRARFDQLPQLVKNYIFVAMIVVVTGSLSMFCFYFFKLYETTKRVQVLESQQSFIEDIIGKYRRGVCFIQGSYYLIDGNSGKPLRMMADGTPVTRNFSGTGFLINEKGIILTNRHIANPIWSKSRGQKDSGYISRLPKSVVVKFSALRAFFPEVKYYFPLKVETVSDKADVALLSFNPNGERLPVLPLDTSGDDAKIGEPVILLGYPAGINAIFGKTSQDVVDELIALPVLQIGEELSKRNLIRPLVTQGHVTDITPDKIIYDAQTTLGGSGGPLINLSGKVIGINFGILKSFKGSNFAVPIKFADGLIGQ